MVGVVAAALVAGACGYAGGTIEVGAGAATAGGPTPERSAVEPAPGISVTVLQGDRPIVYDVVLDDEGCALAGTYYWGAGEDPTVWSGPDCDTALTSAPPPPVGEPEWPFDYDKRSVRGLVRSGGEAPLLGVGYWEEHSDFFPTRGLAFDIGRPEDIDPLEPPSRPPVHERAAVIDDDQVVFNGIARLSSGRLVVTGARLVEGDRLPTVWWSDDELDTLHEVALPHDGITWGEADEIALDGSGRMAVLGAGTPTGSSLDRQALAWWTDDGSTWHAATHDGSFAGPPAIYPTGIAHNDDGWVAVGYSYTTGDDEQARLWRSTDGSEWVLDAEGAPVADTRSAFGAVLGGPDGRLVVFGTATLPTGPLDELRYVAVAWELVDGEWSARILGEDRPRLAAGDACSWVAVGAVSLWAADAGIPCPTDPPPTTPPPPPTIPSTLPTVPITAPPPTSPAPTPAPAALPTRVVATPRFAG